jgi:hypothetical protein
LVVICNDYNTNNTNNIIREREREMGCCSCSWPRRAWGGFIALRRSPLTSLFVVCVAIFTDMLVYGMVVPIFVPEILNVTTIEVLLPSLLHQIRPRS